MALFWGIVAGVFALDRAAKIASENLLLPGRSLAALPGLLEWRLSYNQGMALGILSGSRWLILILPILAVGAGWLAMRRYCGTGYTRASCALVVGGFIGNWVDRLCYGHVVDMIYFPWMPWYVCNVADIAICAGVAMLAISLLARPQDWRERNDPDRAA